MLSWSVNRHLELKQISEGFYKSGQIVNTILRVLSSCVFSKQLLGEAATVLVCPNLTHELSGRLPVGCHVKFV